MMKSGKSCRAAFPRCRFTALSSAVSAGLRNTGLGSPVNRQARKPALQESGITIIEVVVIVVGLMMLALALAAWWAKTHQRWARINCTNNAHQMGLAFKTWALDNQDKYAMEVSVTNGGAMEFVRTGNVASVFEVMSNELNTPKVLVCPEDTKRFYPSDFNNTLSNLNVSYFIGVDADDTQPYMFLAGDRNVTTNGVQLTSGGVHLLRTNSPVGWTSDMHKNSGNVLTVDGSAQQWNNRQLRSALELSGTTNRIAVP